jgi:polysaccharide pyruvyl transferase WcaK-like protein
MSQRVLMEGYYGRGNFGDDVLMAVTYNVLRQQLPNATISVVIGDHQRNYVANLLPGVLVERPDRHAHYDMIVHGGGGVFFDFARYGALYQLLETIVRAMGFKAFLLLEKLSRKLIAKPRFTTNKRLGMGIGVGSFTPGSPRMLRSLPILADFKALWVRDTQSTEQLARYKEILSAEIIQGSDLAFLSEHWSKPVTKTAGTKPRLGIALRDWPDTNTAALQTALQELAKEYEITGFIFDEFADSETTHLLALYTTHIWQPGTMNIVDFAATLAAQDVLLTSRAHGAICGAALGVASVIVNIEPKMEQIHAMLPNSTVLSYPREAPLWPDAIKHARAITADTIAKDVGRNRAASENALQQMKRWLV